MSVPAQESAPRRKHRSGEFLLTASMRFEYTAAHCLGPQNDAVDGLLSFDWPRRSEQACGAFLFLGPVQLFVFGTALARQPSYSATGKCSGIAYPCLASRRLFAAALIPLRIGTMLSAYVIDVAVFLLLVAVTISLH